MGHQWVTDVPEPIYVGTEDEAYALMRFLLKKRDLYPDEPIAFDTETNALKVPVRGRWDEQGHLVEDAPVSASDPLDWMRDTITFWSLAARVDRDTGPLFEEYIKEFHPEMKLYSYARWCIAGDLFYIFVDLLEDPATIIATWNGKYDGHVSWNSGIDIWQAQVWDLLVAAHLLDENLQGRMGLKVRSEDWLGLPGIKFADLFDRDVHGNKAIEYVTSLFDLPLDDVVHYSSYDAYLTLKLYEYLMEKLSVIIVSPDYTMWNHFVDTEVPYTKVLWRMERRGLNLDIDNLKEVQPRVETEINKLGKDISREMGRCINLKSPKQLSAYFFGESKMVTINGKKVNKGGLGLKPIKMTKRGGSTPSTDETVLEVLEENGVEVAKMLLRYRKVEKIMSTYIHALWALSYHYKDGRIHPNFNQHGARTGRLSSTGPNSQNFPRPDTDEFGIRTMFTAGPGNLLIVGDYEQLEMRIMGHFSQDKAMLQAIRNNQDLHCFTVSLMNNVPYEEAVAAKEKKEAAKKDKSIKLTDQEKWLVAQRQAAKAIGFGLIYGAGPPRIATQLEITIEEAKNKINSYFATFPGVTRFIKDTHLICLHRARNLKGNPRGELGYVETLVGRRRRLCDITNANYQLRGLAEREAVNSIIQGTAADIVKVAMIGMEFDPELNLMGANLENQIHDEIVVEVPEENAEAALVVIKQYMEYPFGGNQALCIPTPADLHIVDNWSQAK